MVTDGARLLTDGARLLTDTYCCCCRNTLTRARVRVHGRILGDSPMGTLISGSLSVQRPWGPSDLRAPPPGGGTLLYTGMTQCPVW